MLGLCVLGIMSESHDKPSPVEIDSLGQQRPLPDEEHAARAVLASRVRGDKACDLARPEVVLG